MKKAAINWIMVLLAAVAAGCGNGVEKAYGPVEVTERVYAYIAPSPETADGLGANAGFIIGDEGVMVIDSRFTPNQGEELLGVIRSLTDLPVTYLVNTHYHPENTWGNQVFREEGALIMARPETIRDMDIYTPMYLEYYKRHKPEVFSLLGGLKPTLPDSAVGDRTEIDLGGVTVVLEYPGPGHTAGDILISVDGGRVVFAGGLVSFGYHPNMADRGADYDNWLNILGKIREISPGHIVPGEGRVCTPREIKETRDYIEGLRGLARGLIDKGLSFKDAAASVKAGDFMPEAGRFHHANLLPFNVKAVLQKEAVSAIDPDFELETPEGFIVSDGSGGKEQGHILWTKFTNMGYEEIEVQWQRSARSEILIQDIYQRVANFRSSAQEREYRPEGKKKILLGKEEQNAVFGEWVERTRGIGGGGIWMMTMAVGGGRAYTIQWSVSIEGGGEAAERKLEELEKTLSTFRINAENK